MGRHSIAYVVAGDTVFSLEYNVGIVLHPYVHLLVFVRDYLPTGGCEGDCLALGRI